jgi:hypothetical protein
MAELEQVLPVKTLLNLIIAQFPTNRRYSFDSEEWVRCLFLISQEYTQLFRGIEFKTRYDDKTDELRYVYSGEIYHWSFGIHLIKKDVWILHADGAIWIQFMRNFQKELKENFSKNISADTLQEIRVVSSKLVSMIQTNVCIVLDFDEYVGFE